MVFTRRVCGVCPVDNFVAAATVAVFDQSPGRGIYLYGTAWLLKALALEGYSDAWKAINPLEVGMCVPKCSEAPPAITHLAERYRRQYAVSAGSAI